MKRFSIRLFFLVGLAAILAIAQAPSPPPAGDTGKDRFSADPSIGEVTGDEMSGAIIGVEDTVAINVLHCAEISRPWRVGASGYLSLPIVGRVRAAGRTVEQLEADLVRRLDRYLKAPNVTVTITDHRSAPVTFTGGVEKTGTIQLQDHRKLFEAVMLAGGFKQGASTLTLTRRKDSGEIPLPNAHLSDNGKFWMVKVPVGEVQSSRGAAAGVELKPNDVVDVQIQPPRLVHIIGEVVRPGSIELSQQSTVSLTKAMAVVGGPTRLALKGKVMLRKANAAGDGPAEVATINLNDIYKGKAQDLELSDGCIVIIPSNEIKAYIQTASLAAINSGIFSSLQILARF